MSPVSGQRRAARWQVLEHELAVLKGRCRSLARAVARHEGRATAAAALRPAAARGISPPQSPPALARYVDCVEALTATAPRLVGLAERAAAAHAFDVAGRAAAAALAPSFGLTVDERDEAQRLQALALFAQGRQAAAATVLTGLSPHPADLCAAYAQIAQRLRRGGLPQLAAAAGRAANDHEPEVAARFRRDGVPEDACDALVPWPHLNDLGGRRRP